jgi:hypothetical protein
VILPTKGISPDRALLSIGACVLRLLPEPKTVSRLWKEFLESEPCRPQVNFDWFILSLDLLYAMGAIELERGRVCKMNPLDGGSL